MIHQWRRSLLYGWMCFFFFLFSFSILWEALVDFSTADANGYYSQAAEYQLCEPPFFPTLHHHKCVSIRADETKIYKVVGLFLLFTETVHIFKAFKLIITQSSISTRIKSHAHLSPTWLFYSKSLLYTGT